MISRIEVTFGIPVEMTNEEQRRLVDLVRVVTKRSETKDIVHWPSGIGSKVLWREPEEPDFDDSVFSVDCCARERYATEKYEEPKSVVHARKFFYSKDADVSLVCSCGFAITSTRYIHDVENHLRINFDRMHEVYREKHGIT